MGSYQNNIFDGLEIPHVPDEIQKSDVGRYIMVFDNSVQLNDEFINKSIESYNVAAILEGQDPFDTNVSDQIFEEPKQALLRKLGLLAVNLSDEQVLNLKRQQNHFKLIKDKEIKILESQYTQQIDPTIPNDWGLDLLQVKNTKSTGNGIKAAILDSGWDPSHKDFKNRTVHYKSFIDDDGIDRNGHGMHCAGIAYGGIDSTTNFKYGIATEVEIFSGKVVDDSGEGYQSDVIAGIQWAVEQNCKVISISLGLKELSEIKIDPVFKLAIDNAYLNKCIIIAGVGNDSNRASEANPRKINFPAASRRCWGINAIDIDHNIFNFANKAYDHHDQHIHFAAPGVQIYSATSFTSKNKYYEYRDGTSMAGPFLAGITALIWEENPNDEIFQILKKLQDKAFCQDHWDVRDYGKGIIKY